jgi:hypothetical protein
MHTYTHGRRGRGKARIRRGPCGLVPGYVMALESKFDTLLPWVPPSASVYRGATDTGRGAHTSSSSALRMEGRGKGGGVMRTKVSTDPWGVRSAVAPWRPRSLSGPRSALSMRSRSSTCFSSRRDGLVAPLDRRKRLAEGPSAGHCGPSVQTCPDPRGAVGR